MFDQKAHSQRPERTRVSVRLSIFPKEPKASERVKCLVWPMCCVQATEATWAADANQSRRRRLWNPE
jgi:hypothetical protein